jgi:hypothetical protein
MTKKEALLQFIEENVNDTNMLKAIGCLTATFEAENRLFFSSKATVIKGITENFDDNLVGHWYNDSNYTQLLLWSVIPRE